MSFTRKKNVGKDTLSTNLLSADTGKEKKGGKEKSNGTAVVVQVMIRPPYFIRTLSCLKLHPGIRRMALFRSRVVLTYHQMEYLVRPESIQAPFRNRYPVRPG